MKINIVLEAALAALVGMTIMGGTAFAQQKALPKFFYGTNESVNLGTQILSTEIWTVNGVKYIEAANMNNAEWAWAKKHYVKIFSNQGAYFVNLNAFIKTFYKPFHPRYDGPNMAPHPVGITTKQWVAAVAKARQLAAATYHMTSKAAIAAVHQWSPLATRRQWFPDPSDPFFDKSFPVKDLKDGFVLSRKPLVVVQAFQKQWYVAQYIGYDESQQSSYWWSEEVNGHGQVTGIGTTIGGSLNRSADTPIFRKTDSVTFHDWPGEGIALPYATSPPNLTCAVGEGQYVVPLPHWNPKWVLTPQGS